MSDIDWTGLGLLIGAIGTAVGGIVAGITRAWRASVQAVSTTNAKNAEIEELKRDNAQLDAQNKQLWQLLEGLTQ